VGRRLAGVRVPDFSRVLTAMKNPTEVGTLTPLAQVALLMYGYRKMNAEQRGKAIQYRRSSELRNCPTKVGTLTPIFLAFLPVVKVVN